jgi:isocitrate dehydrogenase
MLRYMGWTEAADSLLRGIEKSIEQKCVTYDLERQMDDATLKTCSEFGESVADNI